MEPWNVFYELQGSVEKQHILSQHARKRWEYKSTQR